MTAAPKVRTWKDIAIEETTHTEEHANSEFHGPCFIAAEDSRACNPWQPEYPLTKILMFCPHWFKHGFWFLHGASYLVEALSPWKRPTVCLTVWLSSPDSFWLALVAQSIHALHGITCCLGDLCDHHGSWGRKHWSIKMEESWLQDGMNWILQRKWISFKEQRIATTSAGNRSWQHLILFGHRQCSVSIVSHQHTSNSGEIIPLVADVRKSLSSPVFHKFTVGSFGNSRQYLEPSESH